MAPARQRHRARLRHRRAAREILGPELGVFDLQPFALVARRGRAGDVLSQLGVLVLHLTETRLLRLQQLILDRQVLAQGLLALGDDRPGQSLLQLCLLGLPVRGLLVGSGLHLVESAAQSLGLSVALVQLSLGGGQALAQTDDLVVGGVGLLAQTSGLTAQSEELGRGRRLADGGGVRERRRRTTSDRHQTRGKEQDRSQGRTEPEKDLGLHDVPRRTEISTRRLCRSASGVATPDRGPARSEGAKHDAAPGDPQVDQTAHHRPGALAGSAGR